jgi:bifunctional UDP-N-acetylglucosamine pyrophosphorylase/glucosamine-1-phosphate N-acetyltransferase
MCWTRRKACGCTQKVVIIGHEAELVRDMVGDQAQVVLQARAVRHRSCGAAGGAGFAGRYRHGFNLVRRHAAPGSRGAGQICRAHEKSGAAATVMTAIMADPFGYGRILRDNADGNVLGIVEQKDATPAQQKIQEINTGIYCVAMPLLFEILKTLTNDNAQGEYYLTDLLSKLNAQGKKVAGYVTADSDMVMGINSRRQLAEAESVMRQRILDGSWTAASPSWTRPAPLSKKV